MAAAVTSSAQVHDVDHLTDAFNAWAVDQTAVKPTADEIDTVLAYHRELAFRENPDLRKLPEYMDPNSKEWADHTSTSTGKSKGHPVTGIASAALTDDSQPSLVAFGILNGANPPTSGGKIINWGSITRTSAGIYTITLGLNGCPAANSQCFATLLNVAAATTGHVSVADTSDVVKTFNIELAGAATDANNIKFSFFRMPFSS